MPRTCTICAHEARHEIEDALVARVAYRTISKRFAVSTAALSRHSKEHLPALLALARDAERHARADTLLDRIEALQRRTETALEQAERGGALSDVFRGVGEVRKNLELIGRITRELESSPTFNPEFSPVWIEIKFCLVEALGPYPEAKSAVARALAELPERVEQRALEAGNGAR